MTRIMLIIMLIVSASIPAFAQSNQIEAYVYDKTGVYRLANVKLDQIYTDNLFQYWTGKCNNQRVVHDPYFNVWWPAPVSYRRTEINFKQRPVECVVRQFDGGSLEDPRIMFGMDGAVYLRIRVFRRFNTGHNKHPRKLVASYWKNMATGERSIVTPPLARPLDIQRAENSATYRCAYILQNGGRWRSTEQRMNPVSSIIPDADSNHPPDQSTVVDDTSSDLVNDTTTDTKTITK